MCRDVIFERQYNAKTRVYRTLSSDKIINRFNAGKRMPYIYNIKVAINAVARINYLICNNKIIIISSSHKYKQNNQIWRATQPCRHTHTEDNAQSSRTE